MTKLMMMQVGRGEQRGALMLELRGVADGGRVLHASVINHASANSAVEQ